MAKRKIKKQKSAAVKFELTELTGYPDIDEFLQTCLNVQFERNDELLKNLRAVVSTVGVAKMIVILRHLVARLFEYDDFYNLLMDDIETNILQFESMRKMSVIGDEPEIVKAHKNMMVMHARLDEFARQMEEMSGQKLRKKTAQMEPTNVTKEAEKLTNE